MKQHHESTGLSRHVGAARATALALAVTLGGACVAPATMEQAGRDVSALSDELVESARQRMELNQIKVVVREIRELRPQPVNPRAAAYPVHREDPIGKTLEHEFVVALASRVNVVESELVGPLSTKVPVSTLSDVASTYGATHLLVGDYRHGEYGLVVSVRLIDANTHVIVAAARGTVALPETDDDGIGFVLGATEAPEAEEAVAAVESAAPPQHETNLLVCPETPPENPEPSPVVASIAVAPEPKAEPLVPAPAKRKTVLTSPVVGDHHVVLENKKSTPTADEFGWTYDRSDSRGPGWYWVRAAVRIKTKSCTTVR